MDRRHRDYYAITFDRRSEYFPSEDFRRRFTVKSQFAIYGKHIVKVRWYSVGNLPYALISIPKRFTNGVLVDLQQVNGICNITEWNIRREKEFRSQRVFIKHFTDKSKEVDAIVRMHNRYRREHEEFAQRIITGAVDITWK